MSRFRRTYSAASAPSRTVFPSLASCLFFSSSFIDHVINVQEYTPYGTILAFQDIYLTPDCLAPGRILQSTMSQLLDSVPWHDSQNPQPARKARKVAPGQAKNKPIPRSNVQRTDLRAVIDSGTVGRARTLKRAATTETVFATKDEGSGNDGGLDDLMADVQDKLKAFRNVDRLADPGSLGYSDQMPAVDTTSDADIFRHFCDVVSAADTTSVASKAENDRKTYQQIEDYKEQLARLQKQNSELQESRDLYRNEASSLATEKNALLSELEEKDKKVQRILEYEKELRAIDKTLGKLSTSLKDEAADVDTRLEKQRIDLEQKGATAVKKLKLKHDDKMGILYGFQERALEWQRKQLEKKSDKKWDLQCSELEEERDEALETQRLDLEKKFGIALVTICLASRKRHDEALESYRLDVQRKHTAAMDQQREQLRKENDQEQIRLRKEAEDSKLIACDGVKVELERSHKLALDSKDSQNNSLMHQMRVDHGSAMDKLRSELEGDHEDAITAMRDFSTAKCDELVEICGDVVNDALVAIEDRHEARLDTLEADFKAQKFGFNNANEVVIANLAVKCKQELGRRLDDLRLQLDSDYWQAATDKEQDHQNAMKNMQSITDEAGDQLDLARGQQKTLEMELTSMQSDIDEKSEQLKAAHEKQHKYEQDLAEVQSKLDRALGNLESATTRYEIERTDMQSRIDKGTKQADAVSNKLTLAVQEARATQEQLSGDKDRISELEKQCVFRDDEVRHLQDKMTCIQAETQRLKGQIAESQLTWNIQASEVDGLKEDKQTVTSRARELENDLIQSQKVLSETRSKVASKAAEMSKTNAQLQTTKAEKSSLKESVDLQTKELESLRENSQLERTRAIVQNEEASVAIGSRDLTIRRGRMALLKVLWNQMLGQEQCAPAFFEAMQDIISNSEGNGITFHHVVGDHILPGCVFLLPRRQHAIIITQEVDLRFRARQYLVSSCRSFLFFWIRYLRLETEGKNRVEYIKLARNKDQDWIRWLVTTFPIHLPSDDDVRGMEALS